MLFPHPDNYHGRSKKPPFFEGWYYRLTNSDGSRRLAVIPGIYHHPNPDENRSFIIVFDATKGRGYFIPYAHEDFQCDEGMNVSLGASAFDRDALSLDINSDDVTLNGTIAFTTALRWPSSPFSPGVMGPYTHLPIMECYYQVTNMMGGLTGSVELNGETISFDGGRGYIEKNWGSSFPSAWLWLQSNHFEKNPDAAFMLSVAHIPFPGRSFTGITGGLSLGDKFLSFATFKEAKLESLEFTGEKEVDYTVIQKKLTIRIRARFENGTLLPTPTPEGMTGQIQESLGSWLHVTISRGQEILFEDETSLAGMELSPQAKNLEI